MIHSYLNTHFVSKMLIFEGKVEIGTVQGKQSLHLDDKFGM